MKTFYNFLGSLALFMLLLPLTGYGQGCDNKVTVTVGGLGVRSRPGSTGVATYDYCPTSTSTLVVDGSTSTPGSTLVWTAKTGTNAPVVVPSTSTTDAGGTYSTLTVAPSSNTTYTLTSTSGCNGGNNHVADASVIVAPTLAVESNSTLVCAGESTTLTASGASDGLYTWSAPGMATVTNNGSLVVNPLVSTTYTVTANTTCGSSTQQLTINVKALTIAPSAPAVCAGQSISLTAAYSGTGVSSYRWEDVTAGTVLAATTGSITVAPSVTTTYRVTATTTDCSVVTQEVTVTVGPASVAISPASSTLCAGTSTVLLATSDNPAATFTWTATTNGTTTTLATTAASLTVAPASTTTYTVTATTPSCGTVSSSATVNVEAATFTASSSTAVCAGNSTTLTASSNISGATYKWYEGTASTTIVSTSASLTVTPTVTTTYRVVTTTACGSNTKDVTVTVNANPVVTVAPATYSITRGQSVTITASGGTTYSWTATENGTTYALAATSAAITVTPSTTTTYKVTGYNASGCSSTAQSTVTVGSLLAVEMLDLKAVWHGQNPKLTWTTALETDNSLFVVERSLDGYTYAAIGELPGAGTTTSRTTYRYSDTTVPAAATGTLYYRLRQVDAQGGISYSATAPVAIPTKRRTFTAAAYPNPYDAALTVEVEAQSQSAIVCTVYDVLGRQMLTCRVPAQDTRTQTIILPQAQTLPAGLYYLRVQQDDQQQVVQLRRR